MSLFRHMLSATADWALCLVLSVVACTLLFALAVLLMVLLGPLHRWLLVRLVEAL